MFAMLVPGCAEYLDEPFLYRKPFDATLAILECQPDECVGPVGVGNVAQV